MLLESINIHKFYEHAGSTLHVLKGIDLRIKEGEVVSIFGPSGVGKSTLLHILGGLEMPNDGTVILQGEEIYALHDAERAKIRNQKIGFVFQFYHLLPEFTALENVLLPILISRDKNNVEELKKQAEAVLEKVGLKPRLSHKPYQLSGGEQQRVAIARSLVNDPQIIFCDEPTGNLDSETGKGIIDLLMDLNKKNNQTIVIVTHDESIAKLSSRTIHMQDGKLV